MTGDGGNEGRVTAPMQPYSIRDVGIGLLVLAIGVLIAYVVPALA